MTSCNPESIEKMIFGKNRLNSFRNCLKSNEFDSRFGSGKLQGGYGALIFFDKMNGFPLIILNAFVDDCVIVDELIGSQGMNDGVVNDQLNNDRPPQGMIFPECEMFVKSFESV